MMKKICFLIGSMGHSGGTERVTSIIANQLISQNYDISILSLSNGNSSFFELDSRIKLDSMFDNKVSMKKNFISCCYKIRKYVQKNKIDTLIVVDSISCVFTVPALFGLKIKHICWEHFNFNVNLGVKYRDIGRRWAAKYCDYVITLTKRDKELWEQGLTCINANIQPIANPTPYENIINKPSQEYRTVLAMGRLTNQKGFDILLNAWHDVSKVHSNWILNIVGSGEDEFKLKTLAKELNLEDNVKFFPTTKDVVSFYNTASIFCLSSRYEGFGMVILEAMSFSLPIVSFNCDCGPSDLIVDGGNGFLVDNGNKELLAKALSNLIKMDTESYQNKVKSSLILSEKYKATQLIVKWKEII